MASKQKLDGAGAAKLETLESALATLQTIHGVVEQMALAVRGNTTTAPYVQKIRRTASPLVGLLKGQFGMISDLVSNMVLVATRGASDKTRLRGLRESVASIRMHLEVQQKRVVEQHTVEEDPGM